MKKLLLFIAVPVILFILIFLFQAGNLILGGEGNYFLDVKAIQNLYGSAWFSLGSGIGSSNPLVHQPFAVFNFISTLQSFSIPYRAINLIFVFLMYYLPFLSMFWLLYKILRFNFNVSFLAALFYILNPFSIIHFQFLMFWNIAPFIVFPITFGIIYKFYRQPLYLFTAFGTFVLIFAFSFANIPYLVLFHLFLPFAISLSGYLHAAKFELKHACKNYFLLLLSFSLFNLWWLLPLIRFQIQDLSALYNPSDAIEYVQGSIGGRTFLLRLFTFKTYVSEPSDHFIASYFNNPLITILLFIPFGLLIYGYFTKRVRGSKIIIPTVFLLVALFLNKGSTEPFASVNVFLLEKLPLFFVFKTPLEKFSVLSVFLFTITIALILNHRGKFFNAAFILYLAICSVPFLTLQFIPDYLIGNDRYVTKKFVDKSDYQLFRSTINNDSYESRLLSLPGSYNYQVTMQNHENKYYRGLDPLLFSVNKPFLAAYWSNRFDDIYRNLSNPNIGKLLGVYNVQNIVLNHDIYPSFAVKEKATAKQLDAIFARSMQSKKFGPITVYKNPTYVPHIYSATNLITTVSEPNVLPAIMLDNKFSVRSAVVMRRLIPAELDDKLSSLKNPVDINEEPTIEFRKINPSKYVVRVNGAKNDFVLVFAEEFHKGWKMYLPNLNKTTLSLTDLSLYKKLPGEVNQATKSEIEKLAEENKLSVLSRGGVMNFISTNHESSIQNENLPDSSVWLTNNPIKTYSDSSHFLANGYANAWLVSLNEICSSEATCVRNSDGTVDFQIVLGFWPEQLRLIGVLVTIGVAGLSLSASIIQFIRRKTK